MDCAAEIQRACEVVRGLLVADDIERAEPAEALQYELLPSVREDLDDVQRMLIEIAGRQMMFQGWNKQV